MAEETRSIPSKLPARVTSAALAALSLIVFVGLAETIARIADPDLSAPTSRYQFRFDQENTAALPHHVVDDLLGWRLSRSQSGVVTTNSHGFRGPEFTVEKPRGTYRVVCIGDSNPMGFGIKDEQATYPARLEHLLNTFIRAPDIRFEVINLGVDGYSSEQVRKLYDSFVPNLDADALIVQVGFNDYCLADVSDRKLPSSPPAWRRILDRSIAYRWFRKTLLRIVRADPSLRNGLRDPVPRVSPERYRENIAAVTADAVARDTFVLLLTTPARPSVPLVINEVQIEENGESRYVTQDAWLRERYNEAGIDPAADRSDPRALAVLADARQRHPNWPHLVFMHARVLRAQGRTDEADALDPHWRELDRERSRLASYADALRRVADDTEPVEWIDTEHTLTSYRERESAKGGDLYLDFVHVNAIGQVVIATELARVLAHHLGADLTPNP